MTKLKTKVQLIADFKKANQQRKEVLANRAGFSSPDEYLQHLEKLSDVNPISGEVITKIKPLIDKTLNEKPVIHNVVILDASGSMGGSKFNNAVKAYNSEIEKLKLVNDVEYRQSTIIFSTNRGDIQVYNESLEDVSLIDNTIQPNGMTPLYKFITVTINQLRTLVKKNEKVLISIFTDGEDNDSGSYLNHAKISVEEAIGLGWTVTFIGTPSDTTKMMRIFKLDQSNVLVHNNTAKGVTDALEKTSTARTAYTKAVLSGESTEQLQKGFYKRTL